MIRQVTEADFRMPQYRDANPDDYEFRDDGRLARKDRWETAVREIAELIGYESREGFEIEHLLYSIDDLVTRAKRDGVSVLAYSEIPK